MFSGADKSMLHICITGPNKLYVFSRKISETWVLNAQTLQVENKIDLGKGVAHQMVIRSNN